MKIEYTGRQTEVPPSVRALAERKLQKLGKVLPGITHVHVILAADKHRRIAEVTIHSSHMDLSATEEGGAFSGALQNVLEKLQRQAQHHLGRRRGRTRRSGERTRPVEAPEAPEPRPRVIRTRKLVVKPMTVDEAVLEVSAGEEGFLVFRDATTERVHVLYRRRDGNLGLIEPGA